MRHLRSGVIFQGSFLRHHAAKQHHICRRIFYQRLFIFFIFRASSNNQLCQRLCLCRTYENQGIRSLFIIALNANIFQSLFCHLVCFLLFRVQHKDLLLYQFCGLFSALAHVQPGVLRKGCAHGMLPCLRGNSGTGHTAVHGCFGAAGIVPVDAAGRYGLQNVEINIQALIHKSVLLFILFRCSLDLTVQILSPPQTDVGGELRIPRVGALQFIQVCRKLRIV